MKKHYGHFVHRELMTSDVEAARAFYTGLFGWSWEALPMDGTTYWMASSGGQSVAGVMSLMDAPFPAWSTYLSVPNVHEVVAATVANGGAQIVPPTDIPGIGRWACISDPQDAVLMVFTMTDDNDGPRPDHTPLGSVCWETLHTADVEAALAFYTKVAPMRRETASGSTLVAVDGTPVADVQRVKSGDRPHWLLHFAVADLAASRAKVETLGGTVSAPEIQISDIGRIAVVADPQGALFSMFQKH